MEKQPQKQAATATIFAIFGATGDLFRRKLLPALFGLYQRNMLPEKFFIVAFSRRPWDHEAYRKFAQEVFGNPKDPKTEETLLRFLRNVYYVQGTFDEPAAYERLRDVLLHLDQEIGHCSNKLFHLAVPPVHYEAILKNLSVSGLTIPCSDSQGWTRVLVEKPFGRDAAAAAKLDRLLATLFKEEQIFRIDHYLAKETLQNIITFRFSNSLFEPLWNRNYIESVRVSILESSGIEGRGEFYDDIGQLRDVGQNHILQMLALVTMERPSEMTGEVLRAERARVLKTLAIAAKNTAEQSSGIIRARYDGYLNEKGVGEGSETETYFSVEARLKNRRWRDIPFYLESGKALSESRAEISVIFKPNAPFCPIAADSAGDPDCHNRLVFRVQPNEGIDLFFYVKKPGFEMEVEQKKLSFSYGREADAPLPYERVLLDAIKGDQTLFAGTAETNASWKFISSVIKLWKSVPLVSYPRGSDVIGKHKII